MIEEGYSIRRNISKQESGYPELPKYAYAIIGDGESPSTIIVHENILKRTSPHTGFRLRYLADYGCRVSTFETSKDLVIVPEICEFADIDTLNSSYLIKMGETSLSFMFDGKTFGHVYSDEIITVPNGELSRPELENVYAFRKYSGIRDMIENSVPGYYVDGRMLTEGNLNGVYINNQVWYSYSNFNDADSCSTKDLKNIYDGFNVDCECKAHNKATGSVFYIFEKGHGRFSYASKSGKAAINLGGKTYAIPAKIEH